MTKFEIPKNAPTPKEARNQVFMRIEADMVDAFYSVVDSKKRKGGEAG